MGLVFRSAIFVMFCVGSVLVSAQQNSSEEFLNKANEEYRVATNKLVVAQWDHDSNINQETEDVLVEATAVYDQFRKDQLTQTKQYNYSNLDPYKKRQFEKFAVIGISALDEDDANEFKKAQLKMETIYSSAKVNVGDKPGLSLEPGLTEILATSTDEAELKDVWVKWRDATGKLMRDSYITYYKLGNKAAQLNKLPDKEFKSFDDLWMFAWETTDLKDEVQTLMDELSPLYKKIHAYVRFHLKNKYPDAMPDDGTIPAHLLGNMWGQQWSNLLNVIPEMNPYSNVSPIDNMVNENLQNWTVTQMFEQADKFFSGLGLGNMTRTFWDKSILIKNDSVDMVCHASAWDFYDGDDFRIKQCTTKTMSDLVTVHHEMGHIQYFMEYSIQPPIYREGANPGFHEAIGDLIALSVSTPEHLAKIKLLDQTEIDQNKDKINLNYQMKMALDKIVFLPFSYVMDKWRWDVFGNDSYEDNLNRHWWELRIQHQGISPPTIRSENDFDPGAKYHIPAGVEYVRYFVSHVLQFQFYEFLCSKAGQTKNDLYNCDFDGNTDAGEPLKTMLRKGSSDNWKSILESFIGSDKMSLSSLNKYFVPLNTFLDEQIAKHGLKLGWDTATVDDYFNNGSNKLSLSLLFITGSILIALAINNRLIQF